MAESDRGTPETPSPEPPAFEHAGHPAGAVVPRSYPPGVDPHKMRAQLLQRYNIEIASGFGALKDQVWRIGLMGYSSRRENVALLLAALEELMARPS